MTYDIPFFIDKLEATEEEEWQESIDRHANDNAVLSFCCVFSQRIALHQIFQCHHARIDATMYAYGTKEDLGQGRGTPRKRMITALRWMQDQRPKAPVMPDPRTVWLYRHKDPRWSLSTIKPSEDWEEVSGPHKIVPGIMSLDELAERGLYVKFYQDADLWIVDDKNGMSASAGRHTALEAQWAATGMAKRGEA